MRIRTLAPTHTHTHTRLERERGIHTRHRSILAEKSVTATLTCLQLRNAKKSTIVCRKFSYRVGGCVFNFVDVIGLHMLSVTSASGIAGAQSLLFAKAFMLILREVWISARGSMSLNHLIPATFFSYLSINSPVHFHDTLC